MAPPHTTKKKTTIATQSSQSGGRKLQKHMVQRVDEEIMAGDDEGAEEMDVDDIDSPENSQKAPSSEMELQKLVVDMVTVVC
jgi:hypothetical protein